MKLDCTYVIKPCELPTLRSTMAQFIVTACSMLSATISMSNGEKQIVFQFENMPLKFEIWAFRVGSYFSNVIHNCLLNFKLQQQIPGS